LFPPWLVVTRNVICHRLFQEWIAHLRYGEVRCSPGLDHRQRDKNGEISRKHGNTLIRTLRQSYGTSFAPEESDDATLSDVLHKLDEMSLSQLARDSERKSAAVAWTLTKTAESLAWVSGRIWTAGAWVIRP
jgi:hypothetical protein